MNTATKKLLAHLCSSNSSISWIFKTLDWSLKGININGEKLNHLRFADDIVLTSDNLDDVETMLQELAAACRISGLTMNVKKTKAMTGDTIRQKLIHVQGTPIEPTIHRLADDSH